MSETETPWAEQKRGRAQRVVRKRDAVLSAAARLFHKKGFEYCTLNDIADELGVTKPTVYYYFKGKEQILLEIMHRAHDMHVHVLERASKLKGTGIEKLFAIIVEYCAMSSNDFTKCAFDVNLNSLDPKNKAQVENRRRRGEQSIHDIFEAGIKDGTLNIPNTTIAYHTMFGALHRTARVIDEIDGLTAERVAILQAEILLGGLAAAKSKPAAADLISRFRAQTASTTTPRTAALRADPNKPGPKNGKSSR